MKKENGQVVGNEERERGATVKTRGGLETIRKGEGRRQGRKSKRRKKTKKKE